MCLLTHNPECKIAEEPIKVWKLLEKEKEKLVTPMMRQSVKIGETVYAKNPDKPLHKRVAYTFLDSRLKEDIYYEIDEQGVHAYRQKEWAEDNLVGYRRAFRTNLIITEWEIPKGTKYWVGDYLSPDHIVATEMKFVKIC
jgi:hypothetical protein